MNSRTWAIFILAFTFIVPTKATQSPGEFPKQRAMNEPERPSISNTFQVQVDAIFKDKKTGADGTLYFDRPNNIAAMDRIWQNDFVRIIYSFDTDELISITGRSCKVATISSNASESFFPFTVDPESNRKILGSPEEALYFKESNYVQDDYYDEMESYKYQGYIDLPMYHRKNCSVIHRFSKPDFETANCDDRFCQPVLLTINVFCAAQEVEIEGEVVKFEDVDHLYRVFNYMETVLDENVFYSPPGVYCDRKNTKDFPFLPMYFTFSYDIIEKAVQVDNVGGLRILHKKVWYDGDLELIRVDRFDDDGLLQDVHIYDFYNGIVYTSLPQVSESSVGAVSQDLSLHLMTLLPREVFPRTIREPLRSSPIFVGLRTVHGLKYHVWSVKTVDKKEYNPVVVSDLYFQTTVSETNTEIVEEAGQQLSFIEIYAYTVDEEADSTELSEVTFVPINNFRSGTRDFSAFDVSSWFGEDQKRAFEIDVTGPELIPGTKSHRDFLEQFYLEVVTVAGLSVTRISKLEVSHSDSLSNTTTLTGWITESPSNLGYDQRNNESDLNTAFSVLENFLKEKYLEFAVVNKYGMTETFVLKTFRQAGNKGGNSAGTYSGYSAGIVAATALSMFFFGLVIAIVGLTIFRRTPLESQQSESSTEPTSSSNKLFGLEDFSQVS